MSNPSLPRPRRRLLIGCAVLAVVLGIASLAASWFALQQLRTFDFLGTTLVDKLAPEKIEQAAAIKLPPSARGIHSVYESFQDYSIHTRFEIAAADLPMFLAQSNITNTLTTDRPSNIADDIDQPWWQPSAATSFLATDRPVTVLNGPTYTALLVDTSDTATYIIYLVAFST